MNRGKTEKTDGLNSIKDVIHVKMHPCTAGGEWRSTTSLMSGLQCRSDISTSAVLLKFKLIDCDSQCQAGDSLSDLNSYLHWSNSRSSLELHDEAVRDKVKCGGYSHRTTTNEAIQRRTSSNYWVIFHVVLNELYLKLRFSRSILKDSWKWWVSEQSLHKCHAQAFTFLYSFYKWFFISLLDTILVTI